jgi:hypothetical protein
VNPGHTYTEAGSYLVGLTATGVGGTNIFNLESLIVAPMPTMVVSGSSGTNLVVSFETVSGWTYIIEYENSLDDPGWQTFNSVPGDGTLKLINIPVDQNQPQRFFRLRLEASPNLLENSSPVESGPGLSLPGTGGSGNDRGAI